MKISGQQKFKAEKETVYTKLMETDVLQKCIPGCRALNLIENGKYEAELELGIAAVKGHYKGLIEITDPLPPESYNMHISGSGGPGFIQAKLAFTLVEENDETILHYAGDADVGGTIAAIGQRILGGVAKLMTKQFFSSMAKQI